MSTAPTLSALTALSPLDGRYAPKTATLRPLLSEFGLMHRRVQVEVEWFIALSDAGFDEFMPLSASARGVLRGLVQRFSEADAQAIKDIEKTTNHDVKAVEYWLKQRCEALPHYRAKEFVQEWGDEGHRKGWCLYQMGCKGPGTHANCSVLQGRPSTSRVTMRSPGCTLLSMASPS